MIEKWFEPFRLVNLYTEPDGMGGQRTAYIPLTKFQGALSYTCGEEIPCGGRPVLKEEPSLLHEFDVTLDHGDHVRREKDGSIYRVKSRSGSMRAPAFSGLRFAQAEVERVVLPC